MPDLKFYLDALAMADRHIASGERIIEKQRRIIVKLNECGADSTNANSLFETFLVSQQLHENDRQRFIHEITKLQNCYGFVPSSPASTKRKD